MALPRFTDAQPIDVSADLNALAAAVEAALASIPGGGGGGTPSVPADRLAMFRSMLDVPEAVASDDDLAWVLTATAEAVYPLLTQGTDHSQHHSCQEAVMGMAVQVWQARHAPGGQMVGVDLNPQATPHLLGPGLIFRFSGLLGPCLPYGGAVVA